MIKPRTLLFTLFSLSSVAVLLSSCDGDDDTIGTSGGTGGTSASGGDAGKGGTDLGGTGGTTSGASGSGAAAEGGAGAIQGGGGASGRSGNGGSLSIGGAGSPGSGGNMPGGGGNGAEAGVTESGGAGAGGAANDGLLTCRTGCTHGDDCAAQGFDGRCDETLHLCVECTANAECTPKANGWTIQCTSDADCPIAIFTKCIDVGGSGRCAPPPAPACLAGEPQSYPRFGIEPVELVDICVVDSGRCNSQHRCIVGCKDTPTFCTSNPGYGDTCNGTTGLCQCATDDECTAGVPHCNLTTHQCDECETADDCSGAPTGPECHEGRCGCSSASACPESSFPDGTPLCK